MKLPRRCAPGLACLLAATALLTALPVRAAPTDFISDGMPLYARVRPVMLVAVLKRLGIDERPELKELRAQLGGIDPLEPTLLRTVGIDPSAIDWASLFEPTLGARVVHHRVAIGLSAPDMVLPFLKGLAESKTLPVQVEAPTSPLGRLGVLARVTVANLTAVVRLKDDNLILDAFDAARAPPAKIGPLLLDLVRRFPLVSKHRFSPEHGARRLFAADAALAVYADGRALMPFLALLAEQFQFGSAATRKQCAAEWARGPTTFDDAALAVSCDSGGLRVEIGWGTQKGPPLAGLHFDAVDDGAIDLAHLAAASPVMLALYGSGSVGFTRLKRASPFTSLETLSSSFDRCQPFAIGMVGVRNWPQVVGAALSGAVPGPFAAQLQGAADKLRNVVFALKELKGQVPVYAAAVTLDTSVQPLAELLLGALAGGPRTPFTIGSRTLSHYSLKESDGAAVTFGLEKLASGPLAVAVADSDASLRWAFSGEVHRLSAPPILRMEIDGPLLLPLLTQLKQPEVDALAGTLRRVGHIDAELASDDDLLRLTVRVPLKAPTSATAKP